MYRSALIAKMVSLAQEKSPASKLCRDGGRRLSGGQLSGETVNSVVVGMKRVSREARKKLPVTAVIYPQLVATFEHVLEKLIYLSSYLVMLFNTMV